MDSEGEGGRKGEQREEDGGLHGSDYRVGNQQEVVEMRVVVARNWICGEKKMNWWRGGGRLSIKIIILSLTRKG